MPVLRAVLFVMKVQLRKRLSLAQWVCTTQMREIKLYAMSAGLMTFITDVYVKLSGSNHMEARAAGK